MKVLVVGHRGLLGQELCIRLRNRGWEVVGRGRPELDITQSTSILKTLMEVCPTILINAAAYTAVDKAEFEPERAFAVNREGAANLAEAARQAKISLVHISTDYIFAGSINRPYREEDPVEPLGVYGRSKWEGEEAIRASHRQHIIVRTSWLYGCHGTNFVTTILRLAKEQPILRVVADQYGCPTWSRDLADALATMCHRITRDGDATPWGTYHFCALNPTTRYHFACAIVEEASVWERLCVQRVEPITTAEYPTPARRPIYAVLDCRKIQATFGLTLPTWQKGLRAMLQELYS